MTHVGSEGEGRVDAEALELEHQLSLQLVLLTSFIASTASCTASHQSHNVYIRKTPSKKYMEPDTNTDTDSDDHDDQGRTGEMVKT